MIKKSICILLSAIIFLCAFSACGGDDDISLVMPISADPLCLDPQIAETQTAKTIIKNCYEGLVRLDSENKIVSGVAESWTVSDNGLEYTFKLREDTNWQLLKTYKDVLDDENYMENFKTQVTAHDFEFALKRAVDKITDSPDADKLYCIKNAQKIHNGEADKSTLGVKAKDDRTLVINLERANPDFLRILTLPLCMPCNEEFFKATNAKYGLELKYTFCNGPFYLGRWTVDHSVVMYRNEGYKGNEKVKPTAIYLNINKEEDSIITKLKQNDYSCAYLSDASRFSLTETKMTFGVTENSVSGISFNCKDAFMSNVNLRQALLILTKTDAMTVPQQSTGKAVGIIPLACRYSDSSYREAAGNLSVPKYDEAVALELWKKGLEENGSESATIKIICPQEYLGSMQKIIQNWQKVLSTTIVAKVEAVSAETLKDAIRNGKYQLAVTEITASSSTPTDMLKNFTTDNSKNIFGYSDPVYDELVNKIICEHSGTEILSNTKNAEQMLLANAVFLPLFNYGDYLALSSDTTGVFASPAFEGVNFISGGLD
ncbi:MAG: peptide ABC transporter substrate-binding protein [Clostridia bacterium]|nr:peptide ABC transporter substrate-binding protein [Clostridia bacterium]